MSISTASARHIQPAIIDEDENEKRVHRRYAVSLSGRFMCTNKEEYACHVMDISVGGLALAVDGPLPPSIIPGEKVIAYIAQLGGLEGHVLRTWTDGFAMKLNATQHKREKLAAQITWLLNERDLAGAAARKHERLRIANRDANLTMSAGGYIPCLILDVSLSGASLACKARPELGDEVWLSRLRARVVRHHLEGIGIQFMEVLDAQDMQAHFG
ncbi:MAG: PilZ domain-containing protein [Hyphomicrobiaceae bacterium]